MQDVQGADDAAVRATLNGDAEAFGPLVARYQEVAFRVAYLVVRDRDVAEDVVQEALIRSYQGLATFRTGSPFRPWLLRIVTNVALNEVRSRSRRRGLAERLLHRDSPLPPRDEGVEEQVVRDERDAALLRAMRELRGDDQVVLYLRHFLELPEREIAGVLGVRPGTVKSRLNRAGARLRRVIETGYPALAPVGDVEPIERVSDGRG